MNSGWFINVVSIYLSPMYNFNAISFLLNVLLINFSIDDYRKH